MDSPITDPIHQSDAGKGWLSPAEADALRERLKLATDALESGKNSLLQLLSCFTDPKYGKVTMGPPYGTAPLGAFVKTAQFEHRKMTNALAAIAKEQQS